jgi:hypothetical protein
MFYQRNHVLVGLVIGLMIPIVGYALLLSLLEIIDANAGFSQVQLASAIKPKTLALLSICIDILIMQYYRKMRAEESMRGVFIAVGVLAVTWIAKFWEQLL